MKIKLFSLALLLAFISCVPKTEQLGGSFNDKNLDRRVATENATNTFNALSVQMNVRIGDREYIQNVLVDIFGPTADALARPFIINNGMALNGGCSQYEASYADSVTVGTALILDDVKADCNLSVMNLAVTGSENSIREGLRIQACEKITTDANSLFYLIDAVTGVTNVQASFTTNPSNAHIEKIYNRFYPGRVIGADVLSSLKTLSEAPLLTTAKDRFKLVALTVCMSADWQIP